MCRKRDRKNLFTASKFMSLPNKVGSTLDPLISKFKYCHDFYHILFPFAFGSAIRPKMYLCLRKSKGNCGKREEGGGRVVCIYQDIGSGERKGPPPPSCRRIM